MSRDHLTPEQRPTKDGNVVTRWVRRNLKPPAANRSIPAPGAPAKEKTESQKRAEEFVLKHQVPKDETKEQKADRKAQQKLIVGYLKAEAVLRFKYRNDDSIDDYEVNSLFKHLTESAQVDPKIVDETLLRGYSAYKKTLLRVHMEQRRAAGQQHLDKETYDPISATLGAHYANNPADRPFLTGIIASGITDYEAVKESLSITHEHADQFDDIQSYLSERSGPDGLREYLAQEVKSLREGTL